ncbi:hypothetical protein [Aliarcobacter butzleri]|uniref:Pentapeptide repeat-containing protein n=1 Tax=Aliarcobacter butzleri TaxID=28197 RepID=A0AAW7Q2V3_9BACT|nr:hypothetical protein [Aliarcobacter butzleri]MDN5113843.1 hypothetical protein [Aliarcobacter butzleri]
MSKNICSVCNLEFEDEYFDKKQNKCILHCEKDDYTKDNKEIFAKFIKILVKKFKNTQDYKDGYLLELKNIVYPLHNFSNFEDVDIHFEQSKFLNDVILRSKDISFIQFFDCKFFSNFCTSGNLGNFDKELILRNCIFEVNNNAQTSFNLGNTNFQKFVDLRESKFHININLDDSSFEDNVFFNQCKFSYELNLEDTIFYEKADFFKINLEKGVSNRETARIIKDSFEKQNNIIEANKFYALEMKEREKELEEDIKKGKNIFEWLVFKIHGLSSNHSQDWTLALFWIINLTFFYSYLNIQPNDKILVFKIIFSCIAISVIACMTIKIPEENKERRWLTTIPVTIVCYVLYGYLVETDWSLAEFSKNLNPFSIMRGDEPITLGTLIFKIIIAYLIYQLIISIRQNTRRK